MGISPPERETSFCLESIMISLELYNCLRAWGWWLLDTLQGAANDNDENQDLRHDFG